MAANVAHYTATYDVKPSIFDVIAHRSLNDVIHPAFRKIALFLATASPNRFGWLTHYYDEVFLVLNGFLQEHYLRTKDAGFSEYFYGLQRISTKTKSLTDAERKLSLIFIVLLPYIKRKVDEKVQLYKLEHAENTLKKDVSGICKRLLMFTYTLYQITHRSLTFVQYLSYMSNSSEYQSLSLRLLKLKLVYASATVAPAFWSALIRGNLSLNDFRKGFFENSLQSFLELLSFFMQFLQVWNEEQSNYNFSALPNVPPPPLDRKSGDYKGRCPLCLQNWKIPTVLPVSGYVFCFPCIVKHLQTQHRCPVTNLPAKPLDVVRLYDAEN
ncbi:hypothetical protein RN001_011338 [Aquatica leii]|uniref:Peroxisome assembly protein 12 n=1 Tax=Aquatica leii TaxID=1421715 RepID=A0AAN7P7S7_9COLE|nr:hypothetical protein RN001_011338 [Aquatica leii]